jgi:hypothetical protein
VSGLLRVFFNRLTGVLRRLAGLEPVAAVSKAEHVTTALAEVVLPATTTAGAGALPGTSPLNLRRTRPSLFAARLRCVARLNVRKGRKQALRGRYQQASRPVAVKATAAKRSPTVFPVKRQAVKPKRATTRIIDTRPKKKSAVIIRFPGKPVERVKRAA